MRDYAVVSGCVLPSALPPGRGKTAISAPPIRCRATHKIQSTEPSPGIGDLMKPLTRLLLFLSLLGSPALAQIATTSLRGTVTDSSGAVVGGAQVSLLDSSNGSKATHTTSANGEYSFAQIAPGSYSITAAASGFANLEKKAELLVNQPATIDFKLSVTSQQQEVE